MFTSMTARVSTNTYCLASFSRWSENSVGHVTHQRETPTDTIQLITIQKDGAIKLYEAYSSSFGHLHESFLY